MKTTLKLMASAVVAVALFVSVNANGQTREPSGDSQLWRLGVGFSIGLPTEDVYKIVLGGDLKLQKDFSSNISGTLSAGYTNFSLKNDLGDVGFIPVKAGVKIFPTERFYFSGELGAGFGTDDGQGTAFVYAPGIGLGLNNGIDLGLRYEGYSMDGGSIGQVALRIAYGFKL